MLSNEDIQKLVEECVEALITLLPKKRSAYRKDLLGTIAAIKKAEQLCEFVEALSIPLLPKTEIMLEELSKRKLKTEALERRMKAARRKEHIEEEARFANKRLKHDNSKKNRHYFKEWLEHRMHAMVVLFGSAETKESIGAIEAAERLHAGLLAKGIKSGARTTRHVELLQEKRITLLYQRP